VLAQVAGCSLTEGKGEVNDITIVISLSVQTRVKLRHASLDYYTKQDQNEHSTAYNDKES
jgi:DNA-binding cell septation regulator SpoVG